MASSSEAPSSTRKCRCLCTWVILSVMILQWFLITLLLHDKFTPSSAVVTTTCSETTTTETEAWQRTFVKAHAQRGATTATTTTNGNGNGGVAVTLMFRAPQWFHLRYTSMLQNALANLPEEDWRIQVFVNTDWFQQARLLQDWHPGLRRLLGDEFLLGPDGDSSSSTSSPPHPRIVVTPLPTNLTQRGIKPKHVLTSRWFWQNVVNEHVLLFSGNGAFCANHYDDDGRGDVFDLIRSVDYMGTSSGGDGSTHSVRRKSSMLDIIDYAQQRNQSVGGDAEFKWAARLLATLSEERLAAASRGESHDRLVRLATREETFRFAGTTNLTEYSAGNAGGGLQHLPLIASGTQAGLTYAQRDTLLKHCPEAKAVFPSMHEPACFGAHPDGAKCKASICALQENVPKHGC